MATTPVPFPNFTSVFFPTAAPEFGFFPAPPCSPATFGAQASDFFPAPAYVNPPAYSHLPYSQILAPPLERTTPTATQSPVCAPSEFYGAHCLQSSLPGRPKMQQHKEGRYEAEESDGATPRYDCTYSGNAIHFVMPKFRCPSGDLTTSTDTSGMSIDGSKHVHKQQGPDILSMSHVGSTYDFAPAPSPVLDLNRSYGWQPEFQQGATSDSPALHVFDEMPTPGSGYENYCSGHPNPVQSFCMHGGSTNLSEQNPDGMPQSYGFHNLHRQSVFLSDGSEHSYFTLPADYPTPLMSHSAVVNVAVEAPPSVAAQVACLTPGLFPKANDTADADSTFDSRQHATIVQDASSVFKDMPVYDVYEEDATASQSCVHPTVDIIEAVNDELEVKVYGGKPIISPERPTDGVFRFTNERKPDNELMFLCVKKASDDTFSEEATEFAFPHGRVMHADRSIKLTNEKNHATSIVSVQGATVHCADELSVINFKKQDVLMDKHDISDSTFDVSFLKSDISRRQHPCEHSYFALPENYPSEQAVPEPVFDIYDDETDGSSTEFVDVLAGISVQQAYEENQHESEQLAKCFGRESENASSEQVQVWKPLIEPELHIGCSLNLNTGNYTIEFSAATSSLPFQQELLQQVHTQEYNLMLTAKGIQEWDPGIETPSSIYLCLQGLSARIATEKHLSWLPMPELAKWQGQVTSATFIWDPGTMLLLYKSKWWLRYTEEKTNWHKDIKFYQVTLWLIHFLPP